MYSTTAASVTVHCRLVFRFYTASLVPIGTNVPEFISPFILESFITFEESYITLIDEESHISPIDEESHITLIDEESCITLIDEEPCIDIIIAL